MRSLAGVLQQVTRVTVSMVQTVIMILLHSFVFRRMGGKGFCFCFLVLNKEKEVSL